MTNIDLAQVPSKPEDATGYLEIHTFWKRLSDTFEKGGQLSDAEFRSELTSLRPVLRPREAAFLDEPHEVSIANIPEAVQARTVARLYKILLDRQGFHVKRENGGLR